MEENQRLMWKKFEFGLGENFGGRENLDLEIVKIPKFCQDLVFISSLNPTENVNQHWLIVIK